MRHYTMNMQKKILG